MTEQQTNQIGIEASAVLENAAYQQAMAMLKSSVIANWKDCPVRDKEGQLLLLQLAKLTDKFEAILCGLVESGKLAKHRIDLDALRNESKVRSLLRKVA